MTETNPPVTTEQTADVGTDSTIVASSSKPKRRPPRQTREERRALKPRPKRLVETAGPDPSTPLSDVRLGVGTIVGSHGTDGEVKVLLTTDDPEHFLSIRRVFVGDEPLARRVLGARLHDRYALMRLKGITTPEAASALRGVSVRIAGSDARPLAPGEFYLYQLIGLTAFDEAGETLGTVTDIMETGANDVFIVSPPDGGSDLLIPNHPDVVLEIDPVVGRLTVRPLVYAS
jgi:16S rRNA processing protein RimM